VVEGLSERFRAEGLDRREAKRLVAGMVLRGEWVSVSIADAAVVLEGRAARANVDVVMASGGKGKAIADLLPQEATAHRFSCRLEKEGEDWRIVEAAWRAISLAEALAGPPAP
jgi:hypothetical protein